MKMFLLVAAGMLSGCVTTTPGTPNGRSISGLAGKPDWVDGTPARYPRREYLTGVGRGMGQQPCESDARAAIAKIFKSKIEQVSADWQGHFSRVSAAGKVQVEGMAVAQLTRVSTDYVLKGSQIAERWQKDGSFHCLAVLERMPTARSLRNELDRLDVQIAAKVQAGDRAASATDKFFAYKQAMLLLQRREALNVELRIVDPTGRGKRPLHGWAALIRKFTGSQANVKVGLRFKGRDSKKVQTCMAEQLTKRGLRVLERSPDVDLLVHGSLKWRWAGYNNGSHMVKIDINLRLVDIESGKTVAAFAEDLKTGRPTKDNALETAATKLCAVVAPKLAQKIQAAFAK